jgi:transposase
MSTSLLYHGFGINGYKYVRTHYKNGSIIFTIRQEPTDLCCAICGSRHIIRRGLIQRMFKTLPIGKKPVFVMV